MPKVADILFPADYFDRRAPDGAMRVEYESACAEARLDVGLFDLELLLVDACAGLGSPSHTVDFAELRDGGWIVVESGDGQVSGLAAA